MQKKNFLENLKNKMVGEIGPSFADASAGKESREKIRQQFLEISRLGGSPIVMQMGN